MPPKLTVGAYNFMPPKLTLGHSCLSVCACVSVCLPMSEAYPILFVVGIPNSVCEFILGVSECCIIFSAHCDLDLWIKFLKNYVRSISHILGLNEIYVLFLLHTNKS